MFPAIAIATNALAVQSQRLGEIASSVASTGATQSGPTEAPSGGTPVRIGSLPVGDPIESMVSLKDVEMAYRMNAAVLSTAFEMVDALLDVIDPN
jgi:flagellar basal-body rod protein FlgC